MINKIKPEKKKVRDQKSGTSDNETLDSEDS